jgi:hypothetical protein
MRMRKLIALGVSALSAAAVTVGATASPAKAVDLGIISGLCSTLPGQVTDITSSVLGANAGVVTANADHVAKQAALATATTALVEAVVAHIVNVNAGNDGGSTAGAVGTTISDYAGASVAANTSFNKWVDALRSANALANSKAFAGGIASGLCVI